MNIFIRIAFYGGAFYGTQKQTRYKTIQGEFQDVLSRIYNTPIKVTISSRLDRGVSALDFGINFIAPERDFNLSYLAYYLSKTLDNTIHIKEVIQVSDEFSARYSMKNKTYIYLIQEGKERNPLLSTLTYQPIIPPSKEKLEECLSFFEGTHNFRYFSKPEKEDENTILTIDETRLIERNGILFLCFKGKSFLRYQIRFLVGAALRYADARLSKETIEKLLSGENIPYQKLRAEPQGLILDNIYYPELDQAEKMIDPLTNKSISLL